MRRYRIAAATFVVAALSAAALLVSGQVSLVTTVGTSMQPRFSAGDLVVVSRSAGYDVGDVVAYHSDMFDTVVLHRVVDADGGRYTLQGDNNSWIDPEQPARDDVVGKELVHVPGGGAWLARLTHPAALAVYAFALMATGGTAVPARRQRRKRRTMSQHAVARPRRTPSVTTLPPQLKTVAAVSAATGVAALALGAYGWSGPLHQVGTSESTIDHRIAFTYSADVPLTPAYDGTTVNSPDAVFRKLTDTVDVRFSYEGRPGTVAVDAQVSSASGWRSIVPLAEPTRFTTDEYEGVVTLDLAEIDARARAAAEVTGLPNDQLTVSVVPRVTTSGEEIFDPSLDLRLTPLALTLAGEPQTLSAEGSTVVEQPASEPRSIALLGLTLSAGLARTLAMVLAAATVLAAAVTVVVARWTAPVTEAAGIRQRYAPLLVPVQPLPNPTGRPVVDVTEFATLGRLAERYGLLVLHWTRSGIDTFVVQDEGTTFRYRTGLGHTPEPAEAEQANTAV